MTYGGTTLKGIKMQQHRSNVNEINRLHKLAQASASASDAVEYAKQAVSGCQSTARRRATCAIGLKAWSARYAHSLRRRTMSSWTASAKACATYVTLDGSALTSHRGKTMTTTSSTLTSTTESNVATHMLCNSLLGRELEILAPSAPPQPCTRCNVSPMDLQQN